MMAAWVNFAGAAFIGFVVWWFWFSKPRAATPQTDLAIEVADGVYQPARIQVKAGEPVSLTFLRRDPSLCAEKVIFPDFGVTADLPLGKAARVTLPAPAPGEYVFTCDMGMYRGSLVAV